LATSIEADASKPSPHYHDAQYDPPRSLIRPNPTERSNATGAKDTAAIRRKL
jgi:hypothetical protein